MTTQPARQTQQPSVVLQTLLPPEVGDADARSAERVATMLLARADVVAWVEDLDGRLVWANDRLAALMDRTPAGCVGRRLGDVVPATLGQRNPTACEDARTAGLGVLAAGPAPLAGRDRDTLDTAGSVRLVETLMTARGPRRLEGLAFAVTAPDGTRRVGAVLDDTTDRAAVHHRRASAVDVHHDLFAHAGVALATLDHRGGFVEVNHECQRLLGRPEPDLVGRPFWSITTADQAAGMRTAFSELNAGINRLSTEAVVDRPGGPTVRCRVAVSRMPHRAGSSIGALLCLTSPRREPSPIAEELRPVEREILCHVAAGATTAKVAACTHLSRQGVDYNLRTLMERFGAGNRAELVARAYSLGVLAPAAWPPRLARDPEGSPAESPVRSRRA